MVFSDRKLVFALTGLALVFATIADARELRVCADPNNLPFSNERGEGFENKIAELIANELGVTLSYTWWAQRRGFIRNTLNTGSCDLVTGTTNGSEMLRTGIPDLLDRSAGKSVRDTINRVLAEAPATISGSTV